MLSYFPRLYEDELIYSGIARYGVHTGTLESKVIIGDVFGDKSAAAVVDFPSHLRALCNCIEAPELFNPEHLLQNHTLLPAFVSFIPAERVTSVINSCYSNYGGNIHTRLGISASSVKGSKWLHICPKCMAEQRDRLGEAYLQRELQLPGVLICSKHGEILRNINITYHPLGKHDYLAIENALVTEPLVKTLSSDLTDKLICLSSVLKDLCRVPLNTRLELYNWTHFYRELAVDNGAVKGKRIDHEIIKSIFDDFWGDDILKVISPCLIPSSEWLETIFRKHRKSIHPLKHALLWQVFAQHESVQCIVSKARKSSIQMVSKESIETQSERVNEVERNKRRSSWQELIALNPEKGVKEIRNRSPTQPILGRYFVRYG